MTTAVYSTGAARRCAPQPGPNVRVVRGGRYGLAQAKKLAANIAKVLVGAFILMLVVGIVYSQARITELSGEIDATRASLANAQSNYDYLSSTLSSITSRSNIEEIAEGRLGLIKVDGSQITYINLEDQGVIETTASDAAKLMDGFRTAALSLIGSFDP